jgi:voltage-gated potassium channel
MNQTIGQSRYRCRTELNLGSPMIFLHRASVTIILVTLTLTLQSVGMAALIHWFRAQFPNGIQRLGLFHDSLLVVRFTSLLVCLHGLEILLWASFYRWGCFADWEAAFYFSAADYSSVGAGDLLLKPIWRTLGPVESVTGVLMCGLSASFLFAIVSRLVQVEDRRLPSPRASAGATPYPTGVASEQTVPRRRERVNIGIE